MNINASDAIDIKIINEIAKGYNPLQYTVQLAELLKIAYPSNNFEDIPRYELHRLCIPMMVTHSTDAWYPTFRETIK